MDEEWRSEYYRPGHAFGELTKIGFTVMENDPLASLVADPADDGCGVVYADWLEERIEPEVAMALAAFETRNGWRLPTSFCAFCYEFGPGVLDNFW